MERGRHNHVDPALQTAVVVTGDLPFTSPQVAFIRSSAYLGTSKLINILDLMKVVQEAESAPA